MSEAGEREAEAAAELLHAFNLEFDEPTPGPQLLARRIRLIISEGDVVLVAAEQDEKPVGIAVLRFRPALWADAPECYLAELYVVPELRGRGIGRRLMERVLGSARARGSAWIDLNTESDDVAARGLYTSLGFTNTGGLPDGPAALYYELELDPGESPSAKSPLERGGL